MTFFQISHGFSGDYNLQLRPGDISTVSIHRNQIIIPKYGKFQILGKVNSSDPECSHNLARTSSVPNKDTFILLGEYDNGCLPRISKISFWRVSDNVISFHMDVPSDLDISQYLDIVGETEEGKPTYGLPLQWKQFCKVSNPSTAYSNEFPFSSIQMHVPYKGWFNMVTSKNLVPSQCKMPTTLDEFSLMLWNDKDMKCNGNLQQDSSQDSSSFSFNITNCEKKNASNDTLVLIEETVYQFDCLASFDDTRHSKGNYNLFTIAKTKGETVFAGESTFCWIFHYANNVLKGTFYILQPGACDNKVVDDVMAGRSPDDVIIAEMTSLVNRETVEEVSSNRGSLPTHGNVMLLLLCIIHVFIQWKSGV